MDLPDIKYTQRRVRRAGNVISAHNHKTWELVCYVRGEGRIETESKIYKYGENSILLLPPGTRHTEYNDSESDLIFISYDQGSIPCREGIYKGSSRLSGNIAMAASEYASRNPRDIEAAGMYLQIVLLKLSGRLDSGYEVLAGQIPSLEGAFRYICDYYKTDIRLDELAASVGYSPDRFRHIFKDRFGISPKRLILTRRIDAAKHMLAGEDKIASIASDCGFGSASQFNALFKKTQNMTPGEYRRTIRGEG